MSKVTTWVVLGDGRYLRILEHQGQGKDLAIVKSGELEALAKLNYELITRRVPAGVEGVSKARDYSQLLADFLKVQHDQGRYDRLVIAAPESVLRDLHVALDEPVKELIIGEHSRDLLARPVHEIEVIAGEIIHNK